MAPATATGTWPRTAASTPCPSARATIASAAFRVAGRHEPPADPATDRAAVPGAGRLVPVPARDGRGPDAHAGLPAQQRDQPSAHRLLRRPGGAVRPVRGLQPVHPHDVPGLRRGPAAVLLVQLLVRVRRADVQRLAGARLRVERRNARAVPPGMASKPRVASRRREGSANRSSPGYILQTRVTP